jgi:hypothetical protein
MGKFAIKNVPTDLLSEGYYLESSGAGGDVVRIYRDAGDGSPSPMLSEIDKATVEQSIKESGEKMHPTYV